MSSAKTAVVFRTLRVHDNPFLGCDTYVLVLIGMNPRQLAYARRVLKTHEPKINRVRKELGLPAVKTVVRKGEAAVWANHIRSGGRRLVTDSARLLSHTFKTKLAAAELPSRTLVDWSLPRHKTILDHLERTEGRNQFVRFAAYVLEHRRPARAVPRSANARAEKEDADLLQRELPRRAAHMRAPGAWSKPKTDPFAAPGGGSPRSTSGLSKHLAVGQLSPAAAFEYLHGGAKIRQDSGAGQLVWREMFHACAHRRWFWSLQREPRWGKLKPAPSPGSRADARALELSRGCDDVERSIQRLYTEGWVHHLARHVLADYWCGPPPRRLGWRWQDGVKWFERHLIDHDEAVNRGNWMWLARVAFSSKPVHYGVCDYLTRHHRRVRRLRGGLASPSVIRTPWHARHHSSIEDRLDYPCHELPARPGVYFVTNVDAYPLRACGNAPDPDAHSLRRMQVKVGMAVNLQKRVRQYLLYWPQGVVLHAAFAVRPIRRRADASRVLRVAARHKVSFDNEAGNAVARAEKVLARGFEAYAHNKLKLDGRRMRQGQFKKHSHWDEWFALTGSEAQACVSGLNVGSAWQRFWKRYQNVCDRGTPPLLRFMNGLLSDPRSPAKLSTFYAKVQAVTNGRGCLLKDQRRKAKAAKNQRQRHTRSRPATVASKTSEVVGLRYEALPPQADGPRPRRLLTTPNTPAP